MNNLVGLCGKSDDVGMVFKAIDASVVAPFVEIKISQSPIDSFLASLIGIIRSVVGLDSSTKLSAESGKQTTIGTGNGSRPAVIKSLQYGLTNGQGCEIEILDEEGGEFSNIQKKITKGGLAYTYMTVKFGWINQNCTSEFPGKSTPELFLMLKNCKVSYDGGLVKYTLTGIDMLQESINEKVPGVFAGKQMPLRKAIEELCKLRNLQVKFLRWDTKDKPGEYEFDMSDDATNKESGKKDGPIVKFEGLNNNVLECIQNWLKTVLSIGPNGKPKGNKLYFESTNPPTLVVMTDIPERCTTTELKSWSLGTYIVGGGDDSPVIRFNPDIQWNPSLISNSSGGSAGGAQATALSKGPIKCLADEKKSPQTYGPGTDKQKPGPAISYTPSDSDVQRWLGKVMVKGYEAIMENNLANMLLAGGIMAELEIQGDPFYTQSSVMIDRMIKIVCINPFYLAGNDPRIDWTSSSNCQEILSAGYWRIEGGSHSIQAGQFKTTLKVRQVTQGFDYELASRPKEAGK